MRLYEDGLPLWKIIEDYVRGYVKIIYPNEKELLKDTELKTFWSNFETTYFKKTPGMCFPVGKLTIPNLQDEYGCPSKVYKPTANYRDTYRADCQSFFQALILISCKKPKMIDSWSHIWLDGDFLDSKYRDCVDPILDNLNIYQQNLVDYAQKVEARNAKRQQRMDAFNPNLASCSVSV